MMTTRMSSAAVEVSFKGTHYSENNTLADADASAFHPTEANYKCGYDEASFNYDLLSMQDH
jgi:hypothetical protein